MPMIRIKNMAVLVRTEKEAEAFLKELEELLEKHTRTSDDYYYTAEVD